MGASGTDKPRASRATLEDFCREPRRSLLCRSFRNFPPAEVEDALSFAIEQGLRGLCRGTTEPELFSWLRTVMLRRLGRERQRQGRVAAATDAGVELELVPGSLPAPEQALIEKERCEAVANLVARLPERTQAVLRARYFENLSRAQVAEATGLSERQVKRQLERAIDAVEEFVYGRMQAQGPCDDGRDAVVPFARGHAPAPVADRARHHLARCERCREFHAELRSVRWGAAAATPLPALAAGEGPASGALEKLHAGIDWAKGQLHAVAARADVTAVGGVRGPGAAATMLTCAAIGTGGATYCVSQGFPEPVRDLLPGGNAQAETKRAAREADPQPVPVAEAPPPVVPTPAPHADPVTVEPEPAPEPSPPPEPEPQEFAFEQTTPGGSTAAAPSDQPAQPAPAPAEGGGEFGP